MSFRNAGYEYHELWQFCHKLLLGVIRVILSIRIESSRFACDLKPGEVNGLSRDFKTTPAFTNLKFRLSQFSNGLKMENDSSNDKGSQCGQGLSNASITLTQDFHGYEFLLLRKFQSDPALCSKWGEKLQRKIQDEHYEIGVSTKLCHLSLHRSW